MTIEEAIEYGKEQLEIFGECEHREFIELALKVLEEQTQGIIIPKNVTNGEIIKMLFPNIKVSQSSIDGLLIIGTKYNCGIHFIEKWWNDFYKNEL